MVHHVIVAEQRVEHRRQLHLPRRLDDLAEMWAIEQLQLIERLDELDLVPLRQRRNVLGRRLRGKHAETVRCHGMEQADVGDGNVMRQVPRSEERRVGKEWRSRWWPC